MVLYYFAPEHAERGSVFLSKDDHLGTVPSI